MYQGAGMVTALHCVYLIFIGLLGGILLLGAGTTQGN